MSEPNTVDVGCRIPNGVRLSVTKWIDDPQDKGKKIAREAGMIELAGTGGHIGQAGLHPDVAYTPVDADLFQAWFDSHKDTGNDLLDSGAVFKKGDGGDVEKAALEREELAAREREDREKLEREFAERREQRARDVETRTEEPEPPKESQADHVKPEESLTQRGPEVGADPAAKPRFDPETGKPIGPNP